VSHPDYDVIIVGAQCAGSTLAAFLAAAGADVLLVDKAAMPSDQVLSTHTIHPPGMDVLDAIGVGEAVRAGAPANRTMRLDKDGAFVDLRYETGRSEYCPRRRRLDGLIQQAAVAQGATLQDRTAVTALIGDAGRVRGVPPPPGAPTRRGSSRPT